MTFSIINSTCSRSDQKEWGAQDQKIPTLKLEKEPKQPNVSITLSSYSARTVAVKFNVLKSC